MHVFRIALNIEGIGRKISMEKKEEGLTSEEKENSVMRDIIEMLIYIGVVIGVVLFVFHFVGQQVEVRGSSMENTLHNKDRLILEKLSYRFGEPERFDVIVFRPHPEDKSLYYIKRIIGMPGETVQIIGENIFINGSVLEEHYGKEPIKDPGLAKEPVILGKDEYFVMGDNRNASSDSRKIGNITRESISGKVWIRIWPIKKLDILKHQ